MSLPAEEMAGVLPAVISFKDFDEDIDSFNEHDVGAFDLLDRTFFWKIDCYGRDLKSGPKDPADPSKTVRVLTIMLAEEY